MKKAESMRLKYLGTKTLLVLVLGAFSAIWVQNHHEPQNIFLTFLLLEVLISFGGQNVFKT